MLRITIQEQTETIGMTLEGRIAGLWVAELSQAWKEVAPRLGDKKLSLDLRNVTYSDEAGKRVLREICAQTSAELITSTPWTQYLAEEIAIRKSDRADQEPGHGNNA